MKEIAGNECSHGQLKRQCNICELEGEIQRLETWLETCVHSLTKISCWVQWPEMAQSEMMEEAKAALHRLRIGGYFEREKNSG